MSLVGSDMCIRYRYKIDGMADYLDTQVEDASLDMEKMDEKTLTPAEKKKREEVAQAIERDNPNMPMDKKMAIATSTAKRVAEENLDEDDASARMYKDNPDMMKQQGPGGFKSLDPKMKKTIKKTMKKLPPKPAGVSEVSSNKLGDYMRKSAADAGESGTSARQQDKRIGGQKMADDKIRKKMGKSSSAKVPAGTNEETKKVNEISIDKMSNYASAARKDIEKNRNTVKTALDQPASPKRAKAGVDAMQKLHKRSRGSDMYVNKMTGRSKVKPTVEGKARDRLLDIMNKASGRTQADREADAKAATASRKAADKDLKTFRQTNEAKKPEEFANIRQSLKKAIDMRGQKDIVFKDGSKGKISVQDAEKAMKMLDNTRIAKAKQDLTIRMMKSHQEFKDALAGKKPKVDPFALKVKKEDVVRRGDYTVMKVKMPDGSIKFKKKPRREIDVE